jgi:hypothetical protein
MGAGMKDDCETPTCRLVISGDEESSAVKVSYYRDGSMIISKPDHGDYIHLSAEQFKRIRGLWEVV